MTLVDVARLHGHGLLGSVVEAQSGVEWVPKAGVTVLDDDEVAVGPRFKGLDQIHDLSSGRRGFLVVFPTE